MTLALDGACAGTGETGDSVVRFETTGKLKPEVIAPDERELAWIFRGLEARQASRQTAASQ
jgi:hypothetical protein